MADFENRPFAEFFPFIAELHRTQTVCRRCGVEPPNQDAQHLHVEYHNSIERQLWEITEQLNGLTAWHSAGGKKCLCGDLDNGDAVADRHGRVWTITRDGGMVERPVPGNKSNVESAGLHWLEINHGPLIVVWKPKMLETIEAATRTGGTFQFSGSDVVHHYADSWEEIARTEARRRAELNKEGPDVPGG